MTTEMTFAQLPDPTNPIPGSGWGYYRNLGQILDTGGNMRPEVKYYSQNTNPTICALDDRVATVLGVPGQQGESDTIFRLDMTFFSETIPDIWGQEARTEYLNFYTSGVAVDSAYGYSRIIYGNAFPMVDFHLYSSGILPRAYVVIHPQANPADVVFRFEGQDSIAVVNSELKNFIQGRVFRYPQATAYQVDALNNIYPLSWIPAWNKIDADKIGLTLGAYDTTMDLIVKIGDDLPPLPTETSPDIPWAAYYGWDGQELNSNATPDNQKETTPRISINDGNKYVSLVSFSLLVGVNPWPVSAGLSFPINPNNPNWKICRLVKFDAQEQKRWETFYRGTYAGTVGLEPAVVTPLCIETEKKPGGKIYVGGHTLCPDLPLGGLSQWKQTVKQTPTGVPTGFIARFNNSGYLDHATYFGGSADCRVSSLSWGMRDDGTETLLAGGDVEMYSFSSGNSATPPSGGGEFPTYAGQSGVSYFQTNRYHQDRDAFIAESYLDDPGHAQSPFSLLWCSTFGGPGNDSVYKALNAGENLYMVGTTNSANSQISFGSPLTDYNGSSDFPLANGGNTPYFQTKSEVYEGYIAKFNSTRQLEWSSYLGGYGNDLAKSIAANSDGEVYVLCQIRPDYFSTGTAPYSTNSCTALNNHHYPICSSPSAFSEDIWRGNTELFLAKFNPDNQLTWSTYFGGSSEELAGDIAIDGEDNIYIAGGTRYTDVAQDPSPPYSTPPVQAAYNAYNQNQNASHNHSPDLSYDMAYDAFIASFSPNQELRWSTLYGGSTPWTYGNAKEIIEDIDMEDNSSLFVAGVTNSPQTPMPATVVPPAFDDRVCACELVGGINVQADDIFITKFNTVGLAPNGIGKLNNSERETIYLYPNPAGETLTYDVAGQVNFLGDLSVYNSLGQLVLRKPEAKPKGLLDISRLAPGHYLLHLTNKNGSYYGKFTK